MTFKDPESDKPKPKSRLDAELDEILAKVDRPPSNVIKFRARARQSRSRLEQLREQSMRIGPGTLLIASLVFAAAGALIRDSSHLAANFLGLIAVGSFAGVLVMGYRSPRSQDVKRWRGQNIDLGPQRPAWMRRPPKPPKR